MKRIYKIIIFVDILLVAATASVIYLGCYMGESSRTKHLIEEKRRLVFKVYNSRDMLFAPEFKSNLSSKANIPNISITIVDIPPNAPDIYNLVDLHYSVKLGFRAGANLSAVNKALYNGHKTFYKLTIGNDSQHSAIDLSKTEQENIKIINSILVRGDYDGIYMSIEDVRSIEKYHELARKIRDALSFVTTDELVCYRNHICYINGDINSADDVMKHISDLIKDGNQWSIVLKYSPKIIGVATELLTVPIGDADPSTKKLVK